MNEDGPMLRVPSTDGVVVAVHDLGGEGEPFLVCHATGFLGRVYEPLAAALTGRFHVYALDFRGHGDATVPDNGRFDWRAMGDDLEAVIDALDVAPVRVFGHSMGGGVSLLVEQRRPGTIRSAYLFEPIVPPAVEGTALQGPSGMSEAARKRRPVFASKAEALYRYASRPPLHELRADSLYAYVEHGFRERPDGTVELKCAPESEAATFDAPGKPTVDLLHEVMAPVTIAIGTTAHDWTPAHFGTAVADALPNGRLEQHPALGHFGPMQDPVTIGQRIIAAVHA